MTSLLIANEGQGCFVTK